MEIYIRATDVVDIINPCTRFSLLCIAIILIYYCYITTVCDASIMNPRQYIIPS